MGIVPVGDLAWEHGKRLYRSLTVPVAAKCGVFTLMRHWQRDSALVLMYHAVLDPWGKGERFTNGNQVDVRLFREQLRFLQRHYEVVPLEEIVRRIRSGREIRGLSAITFDDGYYSVYENAAPVLAELALPATIFLIADLVGTNQMTWYDSVEACLLNADQTEIDMGGMTYSLGDNRYSTLHHIRRRLRHVDIETRDSLVAELTEAVGETNPDRCSNYRLMDWPQVAYLCTKGISFGVHSSSHPHLTKVAQQGLALEIDHAARKIADNLAKPMSDLIFCYPDGDYNRTVRDHVEATGLLGAMAVENKLTPPNGDPFALPRIGVFRELSMPMFEDATVGFTRALKNFAGTPAKSHST